jgi:hypothetical protein
MALLLYYFTSAETYHFNTYSIFVSYNLQLYSYIFHCHIQCSADSTVTVGKYALLFIIKKTMVSDAEIKLQCNFNTIKI